MQFKTYNNSIKKVLLQFLLGSVIFKKWWKCIHFCLIDKLHFSSWQWSQTHCQSSKNIPGLKNTQNETLCVLSLNHCTYFPLSKLNIKKWEWLKTFAHYCTPRRFTLDLNISASEINSKFKSQKVAVDLVLCLLCINLAL